MRLCVLLSRLTGWGLAEVRGIRVCEARDWLDAAMAIEKTLSGK